MTSWKITKPKKKPDLDSPLFIEGLPGIGNVGKIVVDYIIEELEAEKIYSFFSYSLPHSVFVNEKSLVELPKIELYYKKNSNGKDLLLLTGDVQPTDEVSCYDFCEELLNLLSQFEVDEIITLGGIGLKEVPKKPKLYCTGPKKKSIQKYKKEKSISSDVFGVVGPIIGVSGVLLGLAGERDIDAVTLLSETYAHPLFLGMKGARAILKGLNNIHDLKIDLKNLEKEIKEIEKNSGFGKKKKSKFLQKITRQKDTSYIG
ncbi:hypothetical protein GF327_04780 [Candidatus Woesearchaeota archaeon]|nr:hypothetical protein [Candidatus Woesearchaeota archaeon]